MQYPKSPTVRPGWRVHNFTLIELLIVNICRICKPNRISTLWFKPAAREEKAFSAIESVTAPHPASAPCRTQGAADMPPASHDHATVKAAFTLIELLVVIAIIAILAGMLLPALNKARDRAREIDDISNMKQLGLTYAHYTDSNNSTMPFSKQESTWGASITTYTSENSNIIRLLFGAIGRAVDPEKREVLMECPLQHPGPGLSGLVCGKMFNGMMHFTDDKQPVKLSSARNVSRKIVVYCAIFEDALMTQDIFFRPSAGGTNASSLSAARKGNHPNGTAILFGDGHASVENQAYWMDGSTPNMDVFDYRK